MSQAVVAQQSMDEIVAEPQLVKIGLRANRGKEMAMKRWKLTADYLSEKIPGYRFQMLPYENNSALNQAVGRQEFQFVLTNPASYVELQMRYGVRGLVTLINKRNGKGYSKFGSVIFTRSDRNDINHLEDLKDKVFMGADEIGFGGWRVAWHEMLKHDIDPYKDFGSLIFGGGIQHNVVYAVRDGKADAGSVRTDLLERMAARGKIQLQHYKVIGAKQSENFPFIHSTDLYPEWPFAHLSNADDQLSEKVAQALFAIKPDHPAAITGKYVGWHTVLDYLPVSDLLSDLSAGPYTIRGELNVLKLALLYWHWILAIILVVLMLFILLLRTQVLNQQLSTAQHQLQNSNESLRYMTLIDGLTGLGNRRKLDEYFNYEWGLAIRETKPLCAILIDIDYFKEYNDHYGHLTGDECIRRVAGLLRTQFRRSGDLSIRYGGEEFLVMMYNCELQEGQRFAEMIRMTMENEQIEHMSSTIADHVTISLGVAAMVPGKIMKPDELLTMADKALYQAKESGRNRVVVAST